MSNTGSQVWMTLRETRENHYMPSGSFYTFREAELSCITAALKGEKRIIAETKFLYYKEDGHVRKIDVDSWQYEKVT